MTTLTRGPATALVTGGSKGIGLALAREFARQGYDLVLVARKKEALEDAASQIETESGVDVRTYAIDLAGPDAPEELFHYVQEAGIHVDVLINVASVVAYFAGGPRWAAYVASKAYVLSFSRGLAQELRGTGVTVTALAPGSTATDFVADAGVGSTRVYRWLPKVSVERIASTAYRSAMKGRTTVVPGILNKLLAFLGELHPRSVALAVFALLSRSRAGLPSHVGAATRRAPAKARAPGWPTRLRRPCRSAQKHWAHP